MLTFNKNEMVKTVPVLMLLPVINPTFGKLTELVLITFHLYTMSFALSMKMCLIDFFLSILRFSKTLFAVYHCSMNLLTLEILRLCVKQLWTLGEIQVVFSFML